MVADREVSGHQGRIAYVCSWHLTDMTGHADDVRSAGKADMTSHARHVC
jgi:hypothetical protein